VKEEATDTHSKALRINLDPRWYGTFAEIGAGQEVVRWFFRVGGAAGTVAKSMSAYDMKVSDAIYGHADRYVSRNRLQAMLDREFDLDVERLAQERGDNTSFFAFADTVVARSYRGTNECHGWMGIKFQSRANDEPSQIVMHVRMLDEETSGQQEALGIVGVNLCYGAFFLSHVPEELIESLLDKLTTGRIEIDMLERVLSYVRAVLAGEKKGDAAVGRYLLDTFGASTDDLEHGGFASSLQVCLGHHLSLHDDADGIGCEGHTHDVVSCQSRARTS